MISLCYQKILYFKNGFKISKLAPDYFSQDNLFLLKTFWENKAPNDVAWWFHFMKSRLLSYDGIINVWQSCISDQWRILTDISYFSWHSIYCWKTTTISVCTLPIKWSIKSLYRGMPSRHNQHKFNTNIFKTYRYQRWVMHFQRT